MYIDDYLEERDGYISTEVYQHFRDKLLPSISHRECREIARDAVRTAAKAWRAAQDSEIAERLNQVELPGPFSVDDVGKRA
jgi:hypothetical protein